MTAQIEIAASGDTADAIARHQANGGSVIINGRVRVDPPADAHVLPRVRVEAEQVIFLAAS